MFGHAPEFLLQAVQATMSQGMLYGSQHLAEVQLAEEVIELVPCAELVRFATTGTEAVLLALRVARAYTKRQLLVKFEGHYHGWSDSVLFHSGNTVEASSHGLPSGLGEQVLLVPWNNPEALDQLFAQRGSEIATVIAEPIMCNCNCIPPQKKGFLELLRSHCTEHGAVLIFDEVVTGFRVNKGGAQKHFGVTPDLATFAKAMGGGFPISMVCGLRELMQLIGDGAVYHAGTLNANVMSVAAARASLDRISNGGTIERMARLG